MITVINKDSIIKKLHIPEIETFIKIAKKQPTTQCKAVIIRLNKIVEVICLVNKLAIVAGATKNEITSIAPTLSNALTQVNDINAINV